MLLTFETLTTLKVNITVLEKFLKIFNTYST